MAQAGTHDTQHRPLIAVIDSGAASRQSMRRAVERGGYATVEYDAPPTGPAATAPLHAMILVVDGRGEDATEAIRRITAREPELAIIAVASERTPAALLRQLRHDTWEVMVRPLVDEQLVAAVRRAVDRHHRGLKVRTLAAEVDQRKSTTLMLGHSPAMRVLMQRIERLLDSDAPVSIVGETGCGKQTVARVLHDLSARRAGPFVRLDCASSSAADLASEVLGTERGAGRSRQGIFERAHGGTVLVDRIGVADPATQAVILRVLERGTVRRDGGTQDIPVDVRVVATSDRALSEVVQGRRFDENLHHRLNVEVLRVPPLRDRREDLPMLVSSFMTQMRRDGGAGSERVSPEAMELLINHAWKGNVLELKTVVHSAMLACDAREIRPEHLPSSLRSAPAWQAGGPQGERTDARDGADEVIALRELERREIVRALSVTRGSVAQAARKLGIGRATLYRRLSELNLEPPTVALRNAQAARLGSGASGASGVKEH